MILQCTILLLVFLGGLYFDKKWIYITAGCVFVGWIIYALFFKTEEDSKENELFFAFSDDAEYVQNGRVDVYCGSDLILPEDYDVMGTRNRCLKKGVGVGMGMSRDERNKVIARQPKPGPKEKIYCGDKQQLPPNYDRHGELGECLRKGVGIGVRMPEDKIREWAWNKPKSMSKHEIYQLAHRFKIPTNQKRKAVIAQIADQIEHIS